MNSQRYRSTRWAQPKKIRDMRIGKRQRKSCKTLGPTSCSGDEHDDVAIKDPKTRIRIYNQWRQHFEKNILTAEQRANSGRTAGEARHFNAYLKMRYGGRRFIFAIWEMGVTWIPIEEILALGERGATEHICRRLLRWSYNLSTAIAKHIDDEETQEATRRSGGHTGHSGLTPDEEWFRDNKKWHLDNYEYALGLHQEIQNAKAYKKGYGKGAKSTKSKGKRIFEEMSYEEQWWLRDFWSGRLLQNKEEAAANAGELKPTASQSTERTSNDRCFRAHT